MPRLLIVAALLSASLTGCSQDITGTSAQMCKQWVPIYPSRKDKLTDGTAGQIAGNNSANEVWCGSKPVKMARVTP